MHVAFGVCFGGPVIPYHTSVGKLGCLGILRCLCIGNSTEKFGRNRKFMANQPTPPGPRTPPRSGLGRRVRGPGGGGWLISHKTWVNGGIDIFRMRFP